MAEDAVALVKTEHTQALDEVKVHLTQSRDEVKKQLIATGEIQRLSDELSINEPQTIVNFGGPIAEAMGKCADGVLGHYNSAMLTDSSKMLTILSKIMDKVDIKELRSATAEQGAVAKLFNNIQKKLDAFVSKYNTIGVEIEKVCVELKTYQRQIEVSNKDLSAMYDANLSNYRKLIAYICAGELGLTEVDKYIASLQTQTADGDSTNQLELQNAMQAKDLLEQRIQDLRAAESIALQSIPILKSLEYGNLNLIRKINSSFIVTIPVFKNAVAQAVIIKQQAIQTAALTALDKKTNEMIIKNAQNAVEQMKLTTTLAGSPAIKTETIEQSWQIIMQGLQETKAIQDELARQRDTDKKRLEEINKRYTDESR